MKKHPKVIYANRVNLSGLYSKVPLKLTLEEDGEYSFYSDIEGDFCLDLDEVGNVSTDGLIGFSSPNKKEVEFWTKGATAVMQQLFNWTKYAVEKEQ